MICVAWYYVLQQPGLKSPLIMRWNMIILHGCLRRFVFIFQHHLSYPLWHSLNQFYRYTVHYNTIARTTNEERKNEIPLGAWFRVDCDESTLVSSNTSAWIVLAASVAWPLENDVACSSCLLMTLSLLFSMLILYLVLCSSVLKMDWHFVHLYTDIDQTW